MKQHSIIQLLNTKSSKGIHPQQYASTPVAGGLDSTSVFELPQLPTDLKAFTEGRLALNMVTQDLPCLRIVVIGNYLF